MHYYSWVIGDLDKIEDILEPFNENIHDICVAGSWDWWQIGGRFSHDKGNCFKLNEGNPKPWLPLSIYTETASIHKYDYTKESDWEMEDGPWGVMVLNFLLKLPRDSIVTIVDIHS